MARTRMVDEHLILQKRKKEKFLPIDTKYFKDLKCILSVFDNIDEALDGRLIQKTIKHSILSENTKKSTVYLH